MSDPIDPGPEPDVDEAEPTGPAGRTGSERTAPTPGAAAASRARRIGGRPSPGPRPGPAVSDAPAAAGRTAAAASSTPSLGRTAPSSRTTPAASSARPGGTDRSRRPSLRRRPAGTGTGRTTSNERTDAPVTLPGWVRWLGVGVSGLAVLVLVGLGVWLSHGVWWAKTDASAHRNQVRQQVLATAKTCTATMLSYDYQKLAQAEQKGQACATGQLRSDYTKLMDTTVKSLAPQSKTVQVFQVANAGVQSVSKDGKQWVVLVYGQESVTSASTTPGSPRLDLSTAVVTLNRVGNGWLLSNLSTAS